MSLDQEDPDFRREIENALTSRLPAPGLLN